MSSRQKPYMHGLFEKCLWKSSAIKCILLVLGFRNVERPNSQNLRTLVLNTRTAMERWEAQLGTLPCS